MRNRRVAIRAYTRSESEGFLKWVTGRLGVVQLKTAQFWYQLRRKNHSVDYDDDDDDDDGLNVEYPDVPLMHDPGAWMQGRRGGVEKFMAAMRNANDRNFSSCSSNLVAAALILTVAWVSLYSGSLAGGDLLIVMDNLGRLAAYFLCGIPCFLAATYITIFSPGIPRRSRAAPGDHRRFVEPNVSV